MDAINVIRYGTFIFTRGVYDVYELDGERWSVEECDLRGDTKFIASRYAD